MLESRAKHESAFPEAIVYATVSPASLSGHETVVTWKNKMLNRSVYIVIGVYHIILLIINEMQNAVNML